MTSTTFLTFAAQAAADDANAAAAAGAGLFGLCACFFWLLLVVPFIIGMWKVFDKAGQPGWGCLIPFYNVWLLVEIAKKENPLWFVLCLIPAVNMIVVIILCIDIAKNFGKDVLFGIGLAFLGFIFFPILGFGSAQYRPAGQAPMGQPPMQ